MRSTMFALRFILAGVGLTILGVGMLSLEDMNQLAWRVLIAGPLAFVVGVFLLIRNRNPPETPPPDPDSEPSA